MNDSSQITHEAGARFLFAPEIMEAITTEEAQGIYTSERLKAQKPQIYQAIIELLGRDMSQASIAKLLGVHHRTVAAVRLAQPNAIDAIRSKIVSKLLLAGTLQVERLIDNPESVPWNVASLAAVQLLDKAQLLSGGPTQIIEERKVTKLSPEEFNAMLEGLPQADAQVIATTGLGGTENRANGEPVEEATGADVDLPAAEAALESDLESLGLEGETGSDRQSDRLCGCPAPVQATPERAPEQACEGGRGGPGRAEVRSSQIHQEPQKFFSK